VFQNKKKNGQFYWESATISPVKDEQGAITHFLAVKEDITERKQVEESLLESEVRFKSAFQNSAIGMALISPQGKWLKINSKVSEIIGYSEAELLTKTFQDVTHAEDLNADLDQVRQMLAGEIESYKMEKRYIHKDGHLVWVLLAVTLVNDKNGAPQYFISQIEDITERRQAERLSTALYEISKAVYLTANVNELFQSIHHLLEGVIPGNNFFIALLTGSKKALSFPYYTDEMDSGYWPDIDLENSQSFTVEVFNTQRPLFLNEAQLQKRYSSDQNIELLGSKPMCWLGVPLMLRGESIGVIAVQDYRNGSAYANKDMALLELAANQIAIGIDRKQSEDALRENALELARSNNQLEISINQANDLAVRAMQAEEMIRESATRYRAVFDTANDAIISADSEGTIVDWNPGAERMFGYMKAEADGQLITLLLPARHQAGHLSGMERVKAGGAKHVIGRTVELEGRRKDGSEFPLELSLSEWQVADQIYYTAVLRDITERKRLKEELQQQATTDELTGIFNRRHFQQLALGELKRANRFKHSLTIVLIDIDHFKHVNDTLGHAAGDQALLAFTKICQKNIREIDIFARFGGDEFALLLPEADYVQAYVAVDRIRMAVSALPIDLEGKLVSITISSGIANLSGNEESFDKLLSQADQALYQAKEAGRNKVVGYSGS
jgi:diguanylate cyclase (GGDEF)-like protein/PAS domain S-box-containing protein